LPETVSISCDECRLHDTAACDDCVVSFLCAAEDEPERLAPVSSVPAGEDSARSAIIIDAEEARAVRMLQGAGLVPKLRFERWVG
jgi:hypothetical protein